MYSLTYYDKEHKPHSRASAGSLETLEALARQEYRRYTQAIITDGEGRERFRLPVYPAAPPPPVGDPARPYCLMVGDLCEHCEFEKWVPHHPLFKCTIGGEIEPWGTEIINCPLVPVMVKRD